MTSELYGDRSEFAVKLAKSGWHSLDEKFNARVKRDSSSPEITSRLEAFACFAKTIVGSEADFIQSSLNSVATFFGKAWSNSDHLQDQFLDFPDTEFASAQAFQQGLFDWLRQFRAEQGSGQTKISLNRPHQIVLDLVLNYLGVKPAGETQNPEPDDWKDILRRRFPERIRSMDRYRQWVEADGKIDYCGDLSHSVCTPILLAENSLDDKGRIERSGQVMWLTIDLFRDGMVGLVPDVISLGWTEIAGQVTGDDSDTRGILHSFDRMWELSGLGEHGFSGRWRITNKPTVKTKASLFEGPFKYNRDLGGNSADCAILVALLAAAGAVYDPLKDENGNKKWNPDQATRVFLNPRLAVTATVQEGSHPPPDIRQAKTGKVYQVDAKVGGAETYGGKGRPYVDTIIYSPEDASELSRKITASNDRKSNRSSEEITPGLYLEKAATVQEVLNWILAVNEWKRAWNAFHVQQWESKWGWLKDENGVYLDKHGQPIRDQQGNVVTEDNLSEIANAANTDPDDFLKANGGVNTGSLEYMRNPYTGGAVDSGQFEEDESDSDQPEGTDEQDPEDLGPV